MKQISTKEIVDLFAYNKDSAVLVEKRPLPGNAQYKVNYSVVNFATGEQEVITKSAYLLRKFGSAFQKISTEIPNFVQCDAAVLYDRRVLVIYPNGEAGIFDREGDLYVACGGNKIRKIDGMDYTVSDYRTFSQQVKRYHKFGQYALVVLESGTYLVDETKE